MSVQAFGGRGVRKGRSPTPQSKFCLWYFGSNPITRTLNPTGNHMMATAIQTLYSRIIVTQLSAGTLSYIVSKSA